MKNDDFLCGHVSDVHCYLQLHQLLSYFILYKGALNNLISDRDKKYLSNK